jgi:hypothetical protein
VPVAQTNPRRALLVGLAAVVFAAGLLAIVLVASGAGGGGGAGNFESAEVEELARLQERDGVPALFPDPVGGRQPIFVWHEGDDVNDGWIAFDAQVDGQPLELDREDEVLRAPDGREFPFDGEGLPQYETRVDDGRLVVELGGDDGDAAGVTAATTGTG